MYYSVLPVKHHRCTWHCRQVWENDCDRESYGLN